MRITRWIPALLLAALLPGGAFAQGTGTVTGTVTTSETQAPLSGVQIFIAGTSRGTLTNAQGRYLIPNVPTGQQTVRAVLIGYAQGDEIVSVADGGTATANFSLEASAVELNAIVVNAVTGQAERKRELGTNTGTIEATELEKAPITKMADVLTGRTAGVNLQGVAGTTGTSQRIRIRGANSLSLSNEPLIYVDGVQFSNSTGGIGVGGQDYSRLNDLNAEDIQSVEVLKGPAASALYGTSAANGVLLITTKKGRAGNTVWRGYAEYGELEDINDYPLTFSTYQINNSSLPVATDRGRLNTDGYASCPNVRAAAGLCTQDATASLNPFETEPFNPFSTGNRSKFGLSASGGGDQVTFYISGDIEDEQGVISYNKLDKVNLRANLNAKLRENLDVQITTGYIDSNLTLNQNDNNIFSPLINGLLAAPFVPTAEQLDMFPPFQRSGFGFGFTPDDISNIVTNQDIDRFIVGATTNYRPLSWLSANLTTGLDYFSRYDFETVQPGILTIGSPFDEGFRQAVRSSNYIYTGNGAATAIFNVADNLVSTSTAGASYNRSLFENVECFGAGIVSGTTSCGATSSQFSVDEAFSEVITIGGFFQQQLAINDRIFLAASIRGDDNSAFGQDFGFIYYPSASASWVISEEGFFPQTDLLSNLRLRAALGTSGLRPDFRDAVTLFAPVAVTQDGQELSAVTLNRTGNRQLEPERTTEYELGFDTGLFRDRLSVDFTYFNKESRDALISRRLAPSFGLTGSVFDNLGAIRNWGTEVGVNARVFELPQAAFSFRLSATTVDNEIKELGEGVEPIVFNRGNQRHQEGFQTGAFFGREYSFDDTNGDGLIAVDEVTIETDTAVFMGRSLPNNTQSLSSDLTLFRYLTFSTLFERRAGFKQLNYTDSFRCRIGFSRATRGNCAAVADPDASLANQAAFVADRFYGVTSGYIEDADFIKWREASVTLGVPPVLSRSLRALEGASLTFSGRNLATWTDYSGLDPEINESGGDSNFTQGEFNTQPPVRYLTVRLNFTF